MSVEELRASVVALFPPSMEARDREVLSRLIYSALQVAHASGLNAGMDRAMDLVARFEDKMR